MTRHLVVTVALIAIGASTAAEAADVPVRVSVKAPFALPPYDWSGPYVGFHFGYGGGSFGPGTNPLPSQGVIFPHSITGLVGGYQAGYNFQHSNGFVLGLEADITFTSTLDRPALTPAPFNTTFNYFATGRARVGRAFGSVLPYVTAGVAWGQTKVNINDADGEPIFAKSSDHVGWTAGIGVEYALAGNWTGKLEYSYIDLAPRTYGLDIAGQPTLTVDPKVHVAKLGWNYRFWDLSPAYRPAQKTAAPESDDWSIHGQTTFLPQAYPSFRSPYQGANSLPGTGQGRETWTATAFIGRRLWEGGEVYLNPELAQGSGIAGTLGLAGFSNGEAQKAGAPFPKLRAQRYFFRQTFGFGSEQETVEDGPNQLAGKRDVDRVTLTVGRFAVGDIFDANAYAHDPRADFFNWAIWSAAAYDFPADLPGFTRGAVVELNRRHWALRFGLFQVPEEPNSDVLVFKTGGAVVEWEGRYNIFDQPGKLRVGVFANRGSTGNYREALAIVAADPTIDINDAMASNRRQRPKQGFYVNLEQAVSKDVGVFTRASWNDGNNEILSFTDIDRSLSGGVSIMGVSWGRPNDKVGIGGAVNGLSAPHRDFLAAGGLGLLIGDGALNYRPETIFETFYALNVNKSTTLTFDYQFIANPAYNADRGPVSIFAARAHAEF
jgi:high affinity Mn2+ porin